MLWIKASSLSRITRQISSWQVKLSFSFLKQRLRILMGIQWKPEVLSVKEERCCQPDNWRYLASTCSSGSPFLFSAELCESQELGADEDSGCTGMLALCQPASMAFSTSHSTSFCTSTMGCWCLLCRKDRGQTGSYFSLPTAKCNIIICFVVTNAKANLTYAHKMPAVWVQYF